MYLLVQSFSPLKIEILDFGIVNMYFTKNLQELLHIHFFFQWRLSCGWSWQEVDVLHQSRVSRLVYRIFMNSNRTAWLKLLFIQPYPHNSQFNIANKHTRDIWYDCRYWQCYFSMITFWYNNWVRKIKQKKKREKSPLTILRFLLAAKKTHSINQYIHLDDSPRINDCD